METIQMAAMKQTPPRPACPEPNPGKQALERPVRWGCSKALQPPHDAQTCCPPLPLENTFSLFTASAAAALPL